MNSVSSFLKSIEPAPQILTVGLPLVALNAVAGPRIAIAAGIGTVLAELFSTVRKVEDVIKSQATAAAVTAVVVGTLMKTIQADPWIGIIGGASIGWLGKEATRRAASCSNMGYPSSRNFTAATLSSSLLVGLSILTNGSSWLGAAMATAVAALALHPNRFERIDFNGWWVRHLHH